MIVVELTEDEAEKVYRQRAKSLARMLAKRPERHKQLTWGGVKQENECGTTACAAGWALMAKRGIVSIATNGTMTYPKSALGSVTANADSYREYDYPEEDREVPTLWRDEFNGQARDVGAEWLGLGDSVARTLFIDTANVPDSEKVTVEILFRLGDGRIERNDWLDVGDLYQIRRDLGLS